MTLLNSCHAAQALQRPAAAPPKHDGGGGAAAPPQPAAASARRLGSAGSSSGASAAAAAAPAPASVQACLLRVCAVLGLGCVTFKRMLKQSLARVALQDGLVAE